MRRGGVALALLGAIVGAGFASGSEVLCFFSRFGVAGWLGVLTACALTGACAYALMRAAGARRAASFPALYRAACGPWLARAAAVLYGALMAMSAGAMTAAFAELAALTLPIRDAYAAGFALAILLGVVCSRRDLALLSGLGRALLPLLLALLVLLLSLEGGGEPRVRLTETARACAPAFGALYAAMNLGMISGLLCEAGARLTARESAREAAWLCAMLLALLALAHAALLRHGDSVERSALPLVALSMRLGTPGYALCAAALALSVLSTLAASLRALRSTLALPQGMGDALCAGCCAVCGALGFERLVGRCYPLLGCACAALLLALCIRLLTDRRERMRVPGAESESGPFQSRLDRV